MDDVVDVVDVVVVADDGDPHVALVESSICARGSSTLRINLADLRATSHTAGSGYWDIHRDGRWRRVTNDSTVWWHRAGAVDLKGLDREESALVADEAPFLLRGALYATRARWVDDPFDVARAEDKSLQQRIARDLHISVPDTIQTNDVATAEEFVSRGAAVAKAVSPGIGIAPYVDEIAPDELRLVGTTPTLLQRRVFAVADLRVVVVAGRAWVWRRERSSSTVDWRADDPAGAGFRQIHQNGVCRDAIRVTAALGLSMSVQDWLETRDDFVFLEANPQGAWAFLDGVEECVVPAIAAHLVVGGDTGGFRPSALRRFGYDFLTKGRAPSNDGVEPPTFAPPPWLAAVAAKPDAIDVARRAREAAEARARGTEDKASRLVQVVLALVTIAVGLGAYELRFVVDHRWFSAPLLAPDFAALLCLALAAFEAIEIDRVGFYRTPMAADLASSVEGEDRTLLLSVEEEGRRLADWSARGKLSELMQARAWLSRGLAALLLAGAVAAVTGSLTASAASAQKPVPPAGAPAASTARP